jgi:hypothetical protein
MRWDACSGFGDIQSSFTTDSTAAIKWHSSTLGAREHSGGLSPAALMELLKRYFNTVNVRYRLLIT